MRVEQEKVRAFHESYGFPNPDVPNVGDLNLMVDRTRLIEEELQEYADAVASKDLVKVADAIGDLVYVVIGTAVAHGVDLEPIFDEIHQSNMTKDRGEFKPKKGACYKAPVLAPILLNQMLHLEEDPR